MAKDTPQNLVSVNFRLAPEDIRKLVVLGRGYGNRTRAVSIAIDRLYQAALRENAELREFAAAGVEPLPDDDDLEG